MAASKKEATMFVLLKEPGKAPVEMKLEKSLSAMQKTVGGYIEIVPLVNVEGFPSCDLVCDEEGKFKNYQFNFMLPWGDPVVGTVFFTRRNGGSLTPKTVAELKKALT